MDPRLRRAARPVYRAYAFVFIGLGAAGILGAHLELQPLYGLYLLPEQQDAATNLLNQLRFLRALELGFGLLMLVLTDRFFAGREKRTDVNKAVLAALFAVPAARTISLLLDGPPMGWITALLVAEFGLFLWLRNATEPSRPGDQASTSDADSDGAGSS